MNNKQIGKYLLSKRKSYDMTQADLAEKLNVTYQAVSRWETGESIPDIQTLSDIADLYDVSIDDILQRESKVVEEEKEEPIELIILMLVAFLHIIGIGVFYLLNHFDLMTVGLFAYFVITVAGLFIQNLVYVAESSKTRKGFMIYLLTYVPLVISLMIIAIKPGIK